jgi:hypothetical protein
VRDRRHEFITKILYRSQKVLAEVLECLEATPRRCYLVDASTDSNAKHDVWLSSAYHRVTHGLTVTVDHPTRHGPERRGTLTIIDGGAYSPL